MDVDAIGDDGDDGALIFQQSADEARFALREHSHRVEEMRPECRSGLERAPRLGEGGVTMADGDHD